MSVRLRLQRRGAKKRAFYRIVAADKRAPRDGKFLEVVGTYDPTTEPMELRLKMERVDHWLEHGAQPSHTVASLIRRARRDPDILAPLRPKPPQHVLDAAAEDEEEAEAAAEEEEAEAAAEEEAAEEAEETEAAEAAAAEEEAGEEEEAEAAAEAEETEEVEAAEEEGAEAAAAEEEEEAGEEETEEVEAAAEEEATEEAEEA